MSKPKNTLLYSSNKAKKMVIILRLIQLKAKTVKSVHLENNALEKQEQREPSLDQ